MAARAFVPARPFSNARSPSALQRTCNCTGGAVTRPTLLQRRTPDTCASEAVPAVVNEVLGSAGRPMEPSVRTEMESRFGFDFTKIRIHDDARAAQSADAVGALAYTSGEHVVFGNGRYAPRSSAGRYTLAHELAHTIQQRSWINRLPVTEIANSEADEEEANAAADAVANGRSFEVRASSASGIARQGNPAQVPACATPGDGRHVTLQPVFLRTDATDAAPTGNSWSKRFGPCNTIWNKLGVQFAASSPVTVDAGPLKNGGDSQADRTAIRALWSGSGVGVFFVNNAIPSLGGAGTPPGGGGAPVVSDGGASTTLVAHEVGHTLGLGHPPAGADANTVMAPSNSNASNNPTRNTLGNFNRITWPAGDSSTCLSPDP